MLPAFTPPVALAENDAGEEFSPGRCAHWLGAVQCARRLQGPFRLGQEAAD